MKCNNCGAENPNSGQFCEKCGNKMPKKSSEWVIWLIIVILSLVILAGVWLLWGKDFFAKKDNADEPIPTPTVMAEEAIPSQTPTAIPTDEEQEVTMVTMAPIEEIEPEPTADLPEPVEEEAENFGSGHDVEMKIMRVDTSGGEPSEVLQIRKWFQNTENSQLSKSKKDKMICYRKDGEIVKIRLEAGYQSSAYDDRLVDAAREYFYHDNQLYFVNIQAESVVGERFYYSYGKLIRYSEPDDKKDYYNDDLVPYLGLAYASRSEGEAVYWENSAE